jgi:hypothetical protein
MSLENFALTALLPAAAALLASLVVYRGVGVLALFGAGHLGNCLAGAIRGGLSIGSEPASGLLGPFLWLLGCSGVVLLTARLGSAAKKRFRASDGQSGS